MANHSLKRMASSVILVLIVAFAFCGCVRHDDIRVNSSNLNAMVNTNCSVLQPGDRVGRFVIIEAEYIDDANVYQYTMYDQETNVMYAYLGSRTDGGLTVILNSDGSPMLYDSESEEKDTYRVAPLNR